MKVAEVGQGAVSENHPEGTEEIPFCDERKIISKSPATAHAGMVMLFDVPVLNCCEVVQRTVGKDGDVLTLAFCAQNVTLWANRDGDRSARLIKILIEVRIAIRPIVGPRQKISCIRCR